MLSIISTVWWSTIMWSTTTFVIVNSAVVLPTTGSSSSSSSAQWLSPFSTSRECEWDVHCEEKYTVGSRCLLQTGTCSNPYRSGCLYNHYEQKQKMTNAEDSSTSSSTSTSSSSTSMMWEKKRVCNSVDDNALDTVARSYGRIGLDRNILCEPSLLDYAEIRVHNGNWESPIFYSWIIQIFLSEFLDVPVSVGMNPQDMQAANFYKDSSDGMSMSWSSQAYAWDELVVANQHGGRCDDAIRKTTGDGDDNDDVDTTSSNHLNCAHVLPEVWMGQEKKWRDFLQEGHIDQVNGDGQVGKISWYIPHWTAQEHPQVASYHGMSGQSHRTKLASIFERPVSWGEYCTTISPTNCTQEDNVARRAPELSEEKTMYFHKNDYTGHFHPTIQNDCEADPHNCTGHIAGPGCGWSTNIDAQTYHNDIALESNGAESNGGYAYAQMIQIWRAANATRSHVIMWWWTPDATIEEFRGTDYEFQPVLLPEPTEDCRSARIEPEDRCSEDITVRQGMAEGSCDNEANSLQKVIASSLRDMTYATSEVDRSPGYQAILNLKVNHLDMNSMLDKWVKGGRTGFAAREAVCEWVVEHQSDLESYIPRGYPRVFAEDTSYNTPLLYTALALGGVAVVLVVVVTFLVKMFSNSKVMVYAQTPFMMMVLFGLLLVACGSIFHVLEPKTSLCISQVWLITLGYTFELVPLLVKVSSINRLVAATRRMKRVRIKMCNLFMTVAIVVAMVMTFLVVWTALDPPSRQEGRYLTEADSYEIIRVVACHSESGIWDVILLCWNGILIICATVLAFQSRSIKQEFNDSRALGMMIYSHFVFAALRTAVFNFRLQWQNAKDAPSIDPSVLAAASSILLSMDVITAVSIYIIPKLDAARKAPQAHNSSSSGNETSHSFVNTLHRSATNHEPIIEKEEGKETNSQNKETTQRGENRMVLPSIYEYSQEYDSESGHASGKNLGSELEDGHIKRMNEGGQLALTDEADSETSSLGEIDWGGPRFTSVSRSKN